MRCAAVTLLALGLLAFATPALAAQPEPPPASAERVPNRIGKGAKNEGPVATTQRRGKSSGFWTSDVPTPDRPYRWGYMAMGSVIMVMMGALVLFLIRRATRDRRQQQQPS